MQIRLSHTQHFSFFSYSILMLMFKLLMCPLGNLEITDEIITIIIESNTVIIA